MESKAPQRALTPEVDTACAACGELAAAEVTGAPELARQAEAGHRFHRARLRRRSRAALEERASFTHDYPTSLLRCSTCGLRYRSPRPRAESLLRAYREETCSAERLPQTVASQRALFRPKARRLARALGAGAHVLEVGSFVGGLLHEATAAGLDAVGLDPSEQLSELCTQAGLRVTRSTVEDLAESGEFAPFDTVAIWNTFDQLARPLGTLAAALRVLRPGGTVLLRFPQGECFLRLTARLPTSLHALAWNNLLGFPYLHGHGLESLGRLTRRLGLTRIGVRGDTLGAVADRSYARWARLEERVVKAAQRALWARDLGHAPWLDVTLQDERVS